MKWYLKAAPLLLAVFLVACQGDATDDAASSDADDSMAESVSESQNADLIAALMDTQAGVNEHLEGLSQDQFTYRENDERWNTAEVVEHLVITEDMFYGFLTGQVFVGEPADVAEVDMTEADQGVVAMITDRSSTFSAPEAAQPQGIYASPEEAMAAFNETRGRTIEFLRTTDMELRAYSASIPGVDGAPPMDGHQWFLFISGHSARHTAQIDQITEDPSYPDA